MALRDETRGTRVRVDAGSQSGDDVCREMYESGVAGVQPSAAHGSGGWLSQETVRFRSGYGATTE